MYFVVRIDVASDEGYQRVFGCFDTRAQADAFKAEIESQRVGTFKTYYGEPVA